MNDEDGIPISALPYIFDACGIHWRNPKDNYKNIEKFIEENKTGSTVNYNLPKEIK